MPTPSPAPVPAPAPAAAPAPALTPAPASSLVDATPDTTPPVRRGGCQRVSSPTKPAGSDDIEGPGTMDMPAPMGMFPAMESPAPKDAPAIQGAREAREVRPPREAGEAVNGSIPCPSVSSSSSGDRPPIWVSIQGCAAGSTSGSGWGEVTNGLLPVSARMLSDMTTPVPTQRVSMMPASGRPPIGATAVAATDGSEPAAGTPEGKTSAEAPVPMPVPVPVPVPEAASADVAGAAGAKGMADDEGLCGCIGVESSFRGQRWRMSWIHSSPWACRARRPGRRILDGFKASAQRADL